MNRDLEKPHQVVVVGGGFGGLYCVRSLRRAPVQVTLVDRHNYHLFQPLLYQVATGVLSPANIAAPLRALVRRQEHTEVLMAQVEDIDPRAKTLKLRNDHREILQYDTLVLAAGSTFNYFGHDEWSEAAPGLKTVEDAVTIRRRVLSAFEQAELTTDPAAQRKYLTFVVVGGGPTGVEMAGALTEVARHTLRNDFRRIDPADATILLLEASDRVLGQFPEKLQARALEDLKRLGVTVRLDAKVTQITPHGVHVKRGEQDEFIPACVVLWTAGVRASSLGQKLAQAVGQQTDRAGRLTVEPDCTLPGHPEIFVIGDMANYVDQDGKPLPGLAPVAMQQGSYVAEVIQSRLAGRSAPPPFRYRDRGTMATIGRAAAVADIRGLRFTGYFAWLVWLFVHLMYLVQFQNRVLVLIQWMYSYVTRGRAARLITQEPPRVVR